jgi:hypothetical protein
MAYDVCMWAADGNGESQIKAIRIKRIEEIPEIVAYWSEISDCVRITKERTSNNKEGFTTLWIRPGYVDPF